MDTIDLMTTGNADDVLLALFSDAAVRAEPCPASPAASLAPVHRSSVLPLWVLSRFEDCSTVLRDPRFGKSDETQRIFGSGPDAATRDVPIVSRYSMLRMNPPDHSRIRGLVAREFAPSRVEARRPAIERMADDILDHATRS